MVDAVDGVGCVRAEAGDRAYVCACKGRAADADGGPRVPGVVGTAVAVTVVAADPALAPGVAVAAVASALALALAPTLAPVRLGWDDDDDVPAAAGGTAFSTCSRRRVAAAICSGVGTDALTVFVMLLLLWRLVVWIGGGRGLVERGGGAACACGMPPLW